LETAELGRNGKKWWRSQRKRLGHLLRFIKIKVLCNPRQDI